MRKLLLTTACLAGLAVCQISNATSYTGELDWKAISTQILTDPAPSPWDNEGTKLSWVVDNTTTPGMWHYSYTWTTTPDSAGGGLSHIIIEVSPNSALVDFSNLPSGTEFRSDDTPPKTTWSGSDSGNPGMPMSMAGLKISAGGAVTYTFAFDSVRTPVWGDFYAKDGGGTGVNAVYAYNQGYSLADPTAAPSDGTIDNKILRPDTKLVPDGGTTAALLGLGLVGIGFLARRKV